ncbi:MAG: potassium-transporting ATPase subunit KdpB, partial [Nostoc sp.]
MTSTQTQSASKVRLSQHNTPKVDTSGLYSRAIKDSFVKLDPRIMVRNPVMFVVWVGTIITALTTVAPNLFGTVPGKNQWFYNGIITVILFLTLLFANFA